MHFSKCMNLFDRPSSCFKCPHTSFYISAQIKSKENRQQNKKPQVLSVIIGEHLCYTAFRT